MSRFGYAIVTALVAELFVALFVGVALTGPRPRLLWNASASVPTGLYRVTAVDRPKVGDLVVVTPPAALARLRAERHYLPLGVPLLKHVAARAGARVCRSGRAIAVDGMPFGDALSRDRRGRPLPVWQGCRRIADDELFVMNRSVPDSFDGRYFGPIPARTVIGRATPLFTDEAGDGRFVWRAQTSAMAR